MKTLVSLLCCTALTVGSASAQSYRVARAGAFEENGRVEVGIPTSPLAVDLIVEKEVVTVGPYARYAQKFLGVRGALSDKTLYSVKAARVALLDRDATTASEVPAGEVRATSYLGDAETFSRVPFDKRSLVDESLETAARNAANTLFAIRRHRNTRSSVRRESMSSAPACKPHWRSWTGRSRPIPNCSSANG